MAELDQRFVRLWKSSADSLLAASSSSAGPRAQRHWRRSRSTSGVRTARSSELICFVKASDVKGLYSMVDVSDRIGNKRFAKLYSEEQLR